MLAASLAIYGYFMYQYDSYVMFMAMLGFVTGCIIIRFQHYLGDKKDAIKLIMENNQHRMEVVQPDRQSTDGSTSDISV